MIIDFVRGDIFKTPYNHIGFAINSEGVKDEGFSFIEQVLRYWPELANRGKRSIGEVLSHKINKKTFHALVCYSIKELNNGADCGKITPERVKKCLDSLKILEEEVIAVILMGTSEVSKPGGSSPLANLGGMARSKKKVVIYMYDY